MAEKRSQYIEGSTQEAFPAPEADKLIKRNSTNDGWENVSAVSTIETTAGGLANPDTITPTTATDGVVTIDLPNIKMSQAGGSVGDQHIIIGPNTQSLATLGDVLSNVAIGANTTVPAANGISTVTVNVGGSFALADGTYDVTDFTTSGEGINDATLQATIVSNAVTAITGGQQFAVSDTINITQIDFVNGAPAADATVDSVTAGGPQDAIAIGVNAGAFATRSIVLGALSSVTGGNDQGVSIGWACTNDGQDNVLIAPGGGANGDRTTVVGGGNVSMSGGTDNTSVGYRAGSVGSGARNVWMGSDAGQGAGSYNDGVMIGYQAGQNNSGTTKNEVVLIGSGVVSTTTGGGSADRSTVIGYQAGQALGSEDNVLIGHAVGAGITTGAFNTLIGAGANTFGGGTVAEATAIGQAAAAGNQSIAVGRAAAALQLESVVVGNQAAGLADRVAIVGRSSFANGVDSVAMGYQASASAAETIAIGSTTNPGTGAGNVAVGVRAGNSANTGGDNVFIGTDAATAITGGSSGAVVIGADAAVAATSISGQSVIIGNGAMNVTTSPNDAIAIGAAALQNTTGASNVGIGLLAMAGTTTGSGNIGIGSQSGSGNQTGDNNFVVGNMIGFVGGPNAGSNNIMLMQGSQTGVNSNLLLGAGGARQAATASDNYTAINNHSSALDGHVAFGLPYLGGTATSEALLTAQDTANIPLASYTDDDDVAVFALDTTQDGTNGGAVNMHVGGRDPTATVTGTAGDVYFRSDAANSAIYQHDGTDWAALGTGAGGGSQTLAQTLDQGNSTDGYDIDLTMGSVITSSDGIVTINDDGYVFGDFGISGKLSVDGLIDPTGMVFVNQSAVPGGNPAAGESTLWVRDSDGYLILTDEFGVDTVFTSGGVGGGGGTQTLQSTYVNGNTIVTDASNGSLAISGTEDITLATSAGDITLTGGGTSTLAMTGVQTASLTGTGAGAAFTVNGWDSFTSNGNGAGNFLVNGYVNSTVEATTGTATLQSTGGGVAITGSGSGTGSVAISGGETTSITGTGAGSSVTMNGFDSFTSNGNGVGNFLVNGYVNATVEGTGDITITGGGSGQTIAISGGETTSITGTGAGSAATMNGFENFTSNGSGGNFLVNGYANSTVEASTGTATLQSASGNVVIAGGGSGQSVAISGGETTSITGTGAGSSVTLNGFDSFTSNGNGAGTFLVNGYTGITLETTSTLQLNIASSTGTSGQVLTSDGTNATWQDAGGLTAPTDPAEDGYIPVASGGDLTYLRGDADGDVLTWNESLETWESQTPASSGSGPTTGTVFSATDTTTDATPTAVGSFTTTANDEVYLVQAEIIARDVSNGESAGYEIKGVFERSAGTVTLLNSSTTMTVEEEEDTSWAVDFNINGSDIEVQVTGDGTNNVDWTVFGNVRVLGDTNSGLGAGGGGGGVSESEITGTPGATEDDYTPTGWDTATVVRLNPAAASSITGFDGTASVVRKTLFNVSSFNITLRDEDVNSSASNRMALPGDIIIQPNGGVDLVYDSTSSRWRAK